MPYIVVLVYMMIRPDVRLALAMEADGQEDKKTRERTEGAATAKQAMHGDRFFASWLDPGPKTNSTSFGVKTKPPALPCRDDIVIENGAAAPKSCLSPLEMRTPSVTGGLLPTVQQRGPPSTSHLFRSTQPKRQIYGL